MDYIREFDIRLEKEMYYAGETLSGIVILDTSENFKLRAVRVLLRGKAHTEWKVLVSGDRRTVKDDQYFIDDRATIWGKEKAEGSVPILPRGLHKFPFTFQLPESSLPCSFESRAGTIRYYLKVTIDIPYASPPQGMKYFTIIGPHIDCMDYLRPIRGEAKRRHCCLCCESGRVSLRTDFQRSAYVCGESLRIKADIDNQSEEEARLKIRLVQYLEYYIEHKVLGVTKEVSHTILEYRGAPVTPHTRIKWDSQQNIVVPTMPTTLVGVCRLIQIYYLLKVNIELEKSGEDLHMHFPLTIATVPFRIPNSNQQPLITYEVASDHAEGGMYIGPEFLLGQVYDGTNEFGEAIVLYRPVYPTCKSTKGMPNSGMNNSQPQSSASTPNATKGLRVEFPRDLHNQNQPQLHQPKPSTSSATNSTSSNLITTATGSKQQEKAGPSSSSSSGPVASTSTPSSQQKASISNAAVNSSSSRPIISSKKMHASCSISSAGSVDEGSTIESSVLKKTRTSSTSSTGKLEKDTEQITKQGKRASNSAQQELNGAPSGSGSESKIEKDDKNLNKKTVIFPGRAVKLEGSDSSSSKQSLEEKKGESLGEKSQIDVGISSPKQPTVPQI